jgi:eukaryotic-like serine/threonine-protein kinase
VARNQRPPAPRTSSTTKRKDAKRENDTDELEQLGKYRIVEVLGKGAMGIVYKGFDPQIERHVAIKTIRKELVEEEVAEQTIKRFKNEAQAAGRLTHPGIVGIYEYGEDDSTAYIAMEFVQGRGLREFLSHHERFSLHDAVSIMGQLLEAIDYAHEQGIVHRDIKPANIIMMANGKLKVADFGIARISNSNLTTVGSVMGTPSYMSPEQFAGSQVDRRADLFSCGVVFYELLTGSKPFTGATETIAYKICHEPHPDPSTVDPKHVPAIFDRVIAKALAKKPEMRFQNAREFADAIIKAYDKRARNEEETVLNSPAPDLGSSGRVETTFPPPGWNVEELKPLEELLTPYVGPMARIMVKKAAAKTIEVQQLISILASNIEEEADRAKFLSEAMAKSPGITSPGAVPDATRTSETTRFGKSILEQKTIDHAAERLAHYLGPIAKLLAKKAAAGAGSRTALYLALAENIPAPEDKKAFLKDAGIK